MSAPQGSLRDQDATGEARELLFLQACQPVHWGWDGPDPRTEESATEDRLGGSDFVGHLLEKFVRYSRCPRLDFYEDRGARGLRHECGPQLTARQFNAEVNWPAIRNSRAYVGAPECNGLIERFMRTLKQECIYEHPFRTLEETRFVIGRFIQQYNSE